MTEFNAVDDRKESAEAGDEEPDEAALTVYPSRCAPLLCALCGAGSYP